MKVIQKTVRVCIAIGGLLMVAGLVLAGVFVLALSNIISLDRVFNQTNLSMLALMFFVVGIVNLIAGMIVLRRR